LSIPKSAAALQQTAKIERYVMRIATIVSDTRVSTGELGEYHYQRFLQWAFVQRQSKAAFARNILVARTDTNSEGIDQGLEFYAARYKISIDELCELIAQLDNEKKSISQIHAALEERFGQSLE
jgi:hypothetical protein